MVKSQESSGYLILVVDDEVNMREVKKELLKRAGYRVIEASNGQEGLDLARSERPRLIIMNYLMGVMDGARASRIIKADPELKHIPIIMNSACDENKTREVALGAGCDDYIVEPTSTDVLLKKVRALVLIG
ncbi:MAG TPA: response regulator [Pyrinomonadaceae bacterium]